MDAFTTKTMQILERSLDAASLRQKVLSNNIANVDTPNFKRSDISFESALQASLNQDTSSIRGFRTDSRHIPIGPPSFNEIRAEIIAEPSSTVNNNGNNVDIDSEMTQLAVNQIKYNALIQDLNGYLARLRSAIQGGR